MHVLIFIFFFIFTVSPSVEEAESILKHIYLKYSMLFYNISST